MVSVTDEELGRAYCEKYGYVPCTQGIIEGDWCVTKPFDGIYYSWAKLFLEAKRLPEYLFAALETEMLGLGTPHPWSASPGTYYGEARAYAAVGKAIKMIVDNILTGLGYEA
jgi:hypothetical protein